MANSDPSDDLMENVSVPFGDFISSVGKGVAEAQQALDAQALENFKSIYTQEEGALKALRDLGYQPTWYQIPEVTAELNVALTLSGTSQQTSTQSRQSSPDSSSTEGASSRQMYATAIDATYTNTYGYDLKSSSKITFRLVPVPPPQGAESLKVVPTLIGKTFEAAKQTLEQLNIPYEYQESSQLNEQTLVQTQTPEAGTILTEGTPVTIGFTI